MLLFLKGYNVGGGSDLAVAWFHPRVDRYDGWGAFFSLLGAGPTGEPVSEILSDHEELLYASTR